MDLDFDDTMLDGMEEDDGDYEEIDESFFIDDDLGFSFGGNIRGSTRGGIRGSARSALSGARRRKSRSRKSRSRKRSRPRSRTRSRTRSRSRTRTRTRPRSRSRLRNLKVRAKRRPSRLMSRIKAMPAQVARAAPGPCIATPGCSEPHLLKAIDARLATMGGALKYAAAQRTATSEHNAIVGRSKYQRRVMKRLEKIQEQIRCTRNPEIKRKAQLRLRAIFGKVR